MGGRVRTDEVNGFLLDRGFQVFIESYPESQKLFDYDALELRPFLPGALVHLNGDFHVVSDPFRRPQDLYASLISPIGSLTDKINVGIKSVLVRFKNLEDIFEETDETTAKYLEYTQGLSQNMISQFFAPFYQGIFLSPLEKQSSRMFNFVFKMFTTGSASIPLRGMGQVPQQIADKLPDRTLRLNTKVTSFSKGQVQAVDAAGINTIFKCEEVVLAVDPESFNRFMGDKLDFTIPEKRRYAFLFE